MNNVITVIGSNSYSFCPKIGQNRPPKSGTRHYLSTSDLLEQADTLVVDIEEKYLINVFSDNIITLTIDDSIWVEQEKMHHYC